MATLRETIQRMQTAIRLRANVAFERAVRAGFDRAKRAQASLVRAFNAEAFFRQDGVRRSLGAISFSWIKRKSRLGLDPRRGHATGTLARALGHRRALTRDRTSITYDPRRPDLAAVYPRGRKTPLNDYIDGYTARKAKGGYWFSVPDRRGIEKGVERTWHDEMRAVLRDAGVRVGDDNVITVTIRGR